MLVTPELRFALRAKNIARLVAEGDDAPAPDPLSLVKFFNPVGPATWLGALRPAVVAPPNRQLSA